MRRVQTEVDAPFYAQFRRSLGSLPPIPTIPLYNLAVDRLSTTCFTTGATKRYDTLSADYCYYALHDKPRYDLHLIMRSLFPVQPTPLGPTYYAMLSLRC